MRTKYGPLALAILLACASHGLAQTGSRNDGPPTSTATLAVAPALNPVTKAAPQNVSDPTATVSSAPITAEAANENAPTDVPRLTTAPPATLATAPAKTRNDDGEVITATPANSSPKPQAAADDKWHFQFSPYFWLASLHGTGGVGNRTAEVDMSFGDVFGSLKFALMGVVEARKGKFVLVVDTEYVSIEDDKATPGPLFSDVTASFKTFILDPEVGYRLYDDPDSGASVDVLGGIRVWHVSTELNFGAGILPAVTLDGSRNWVDAIVGLRGKTNISEKVFVSGKFDLGGGGSKFTWQVFGGLGYNIKPNIALIGGYRVLDVNYDKNNFIYDMNQRGPIMGLGFRF